MSFLAEIVAHKKEEIKRAKRRLPEALLLSEAAAPKRDFLGALRCQGLAVIAEIKRASPSKGVLAPQLDLQAHVRKYGEGGAAAISILTDGRYFGGSLDDLRQARKSTTLPLLRKDFILDPYQVAEAGWAGADAILLILACLSQAQFQELLAAARGLQLSVLVETHTEAELERLGGAGELAIGINNRDLATFKVDLGTSLRLLPQAPKGGPLVAESGIATPEDASILARAGADAVLVGETLVKSPDPAALIRGLREAG